MLNTIFKAVKRLILPTLICMTMLTGCVSVSDDVSEEIIDILQKEDLINLGDLEFEDYSKKKFDITTGNPEYIYDTEYGTCSISLNQYKENHDTYFCAYVVYKTERNSDYQQYFTFKKKSSGKFKYIDSEIRDIMTYYDDSEYGLRNFFLDDSSLFLLFEKEQVEALNSPIADYFKAYEENGELPNIELSLDGQIVELTEIELSDSNTSINLNIKFDLDEFSAFDYLKVGDMYWEFDFFD